MIIPTPLAVALMAIGAPVLLAIAVAAPTLWPAGVVWILGVLAAMAVDTATSARLGAFLARAESPPLLYIDGEDEITAHIRYESGPLPSRVEVALETGERIRPAESVGLRGFENRERSHAFPLIPARRGQAKLIALWARWRGNLGLVEKRARVPLDQTINIAPNTRWVKEEAVRLYARDAVFGLKAQIDKGEGSEFDALREFTTGMDRRAIDWKHSARHRTLLAKEFRTERNHNIVFAFDTGRLMSEPIGGVPKIDRAINAALLLAYVSLRSGDRTMLFGFDAKPSVSSGLLQGSRAFPKMQDLASRLDYSTEEANYTLALSDLASRLERRSLIILFTDFVDTISAELMLENIKRLTDRHLVIFAAFEDDALNTMVDTPPNDPQAIGRAVVADTLLQERELVLLKLQRLGAQVIETRPEAFGSALVSQYLAVKRRDML
ncbi:MAG: DUF58 domain-containing protein [Pseudomonadota bacterium]